MNTFSDRLRDERKRLGLNQTELAELAGVQKRAQVNYEADERFPDAAYLMAIAEAGADVRYILTGSRDGPAPMALTEDEKAMLADYREASGAVRRAARAALQSGTVAASAPKPRTVVNIGTQHGSSYSVGDGNQGDLHLGNMTFGKSKKPGTP